MKKIYLLLLLSCLSMVGYSQTAASYNFSPISPGSFSSIASSGTLTSGVIADDGTQTSIPIGFTFVYCGNSYTSLSACSNGWISLDNSSSVLYSNLLSNVASIFGTSGIGGTGLLMPFWEDLNGTVYSGSGAWAGYLTQGTAPNRTFTFEWNTWGVFSGTGSGNFQVILYESTGQIDFVYGNSSYSTRTATIAIANSPSDYLALSDNSASPTASSTSFVNNIPGLPSSTQIYRFTPPPPCSGTPSAGTAVSSVGTACPSSSFTLSVTGYTSSTGLTYQWQSSPDGSTWTDITGATNFTYTTTESVSYYYRLVETCTSASTAGASTAVYVPAIALCYCTPQYYEYYFFSTPATSYGMANFSVTGYAGSTINDNGPASIPDVGYEDRTSISINLMQGGTYSGSLTYNTGYYYYNDQVWIDFNDNGSFETTEEVTPVFGTAGSCSYGSSSTFNLTIPITAITGSHRMRARSAMTFSCGFSADMDPCNYYDASHTYYYGITRDYIANIVPLPACSGTPVAGAIIAPYDVCGTSSATLVDTGFSAASGLTFQWQVSPDSVAWTNISGATTYTASVTESADEYYRLIVTCSFGGASAVTAGVKLVHFAVCPCTPQYYYYTVFGSSYPAYTYGMGNFTLNGYSSSVINDDGPATPPGSGYEDRTFISVDLQQSGSYSGTVTYSPSYYYYENQIWIDFSDNGIFESSEEVTGVFGAGGCTTFTATDGFTMNIPFSAPTGHHLMRVRSANMYFSCTNSTEMDPCAYYDASNYYYYGCTRDYIANIVPLPPCSGTVTGGAASASVTLACPSVPFTLNITGSTAATGITYQWQSSPDGTTWTSIAGATTIPYSYTASAALYYRCVVTCTASGSSAPSSSVFVNYLGVCYCVPSYYYTSPGTFDAMANFTLNGYSGSTINDNGPAVIPASGFEDRTTISIDLQQNGVYSGSLTYTTNWYEYDMQVWIDFNDDGVFDISEEVSPVSGLTGCASTGTSGTFTVTIPLTAPAGYHRMRVRQAETYDCTVETDMDPCNMVSTYSGDYYYYGVTRDYTAHIIALPPCSGTPTAGTVTGAGVVCGSTTISLTLSGSTSATSLTYQWQVSSDSVAWTNISGATSILLTTTESSTEYYRCIVTCSVGGASSTTPGVKVAHLATCPCTPQYYYYTVFGSGASSYGIGNFLLNGYLASTINDNGPASLPASGYEDRTSISVDLQQGGAYSGIVTYAPSYYYYENEIWIDFNDNGTFETTEEVTPVFGTGGCSIWTASDGYTLNIPLSANPGAHLMRVRNAITFSCSNSTDMDPCLYYDASNDYYYGITRDYIANIIPLPPCSGTPNAGAATVSGFACGTSVFVLNLAGATSATDLTYQWQISADSISWSNISGATTAPYSTTESTNNYYRCIVTCPTSGGIDTSSLVSVIYLPTCPCTPITYYNWLFGDYAPTYGMGNFLLNGYSGSTINDNGPGTPPSNGYEDRTSISLTMQQGLSYTGTVSYVPAYYYYENQIWIDFNNDGVFDVSEEVTAVFGSGGTCSYASADGYTLNIPATANLGTHLMRVRTMCTYTCGLSTDMDPCNYSDPTNYYYYGVTRDYLANIIPLGCSGTPSAGAISAGTTESCNAYTSVMNVSGASTGSTITYQWQRSSDGISWTNVAGATSTSYTASVTSTVYYHIVVTCSLSGLSATSAPVTLIIDPTPTAFTGTPVVCAGSTTTLYSTPSGGTWSSSNPGVATVAPSTGVVTGVSGGLDTLTYTITATGCFNTGVVTVNALPSVITGASSVCVGSTTLMTDGSTGTWSISPTTVATISATGTVTGVATGTATVSFTNASGCVVTHTITVNPTPSAIGGIAPICSGGATESLTDGLPGGVWSIAPSTVATITSGGVVTSVGAGTANVTYTMAATGCSTSSSITVNPTPNPITGAPSVCDSSSVVWTDTLTGGTWSSFSTAIATVGVVSGVVTGQSAGTTAITYTMPTGCFVTANINVNPMPTGISGPTVLCEGESVFLTGPSGGTWSSDTVLHATVVASGLVTGVHHGNANIIYTLPTGCTRAVLVHVYANPAPIYGASAVCDGSSISLSDSSGFGTWVSSNPSIASVVSFSGYVTGNMPGVDTISFVSPLGCVASTVFNVYPQPTGITGPSTVCLSSSITLSDTTAGGTWTTSSPTVASISASGVVTTISAGTVTFTYMLPAGCYSTHTVVVNPVPLPIAGAPTVCVGSSSILTSSTTGGTWSVSASGIGSISTIGVLAGISAGIDTIFYTLPTGCYTSSVVTVNDVPSAITGVASECLGTTTNLADATSGGIWSTPTTSIATVSSTGVVTGVTPGTVPVTYTLVATGCFVSVMDTVYSLPGAISGATNICQGNTTTFTDGTASGTWSSSAPGVATINPSTGTTYGAAAGTATITYTSSVTGCFITSGMTVNALPVSISGPSIVCANGASIGLTDGTSGGLWTSVNPTIASVSAGSGIVTGITPGVDTIVYTLTATGCRTATAITVNPVPAAITGITHVCEAGSTTTLSDVTAGCTWSITPTSTATISSTGVVTGVSAGTAMASYTLSTTGCYIAVPVVVNPLPAAITGPASVCSGYNVALSSTSTGGTWTSTTTSVATIGSASGTLAGVTSGTSVITYTLPTGCFTSRTETVNPVPDSITGSNIACVGLNTPHADATPSGTWTTQTTSIATVDVTGLVHGVSSGSTILSYTIAATGCYMTMPFIVNPIVAPTVTVLSSAATTLCAGTPVTFTANPNFGGTSPTFVWSVDGSIVAGGLTYTYAPANGDVVRVWMLSSYQCAAPDTCSGLRTMTVYPVVTPAVSLTTGMGDTICVGSMATLTTIPVGGGTAPSYTWRINGTPAVGTSSLTYMPSNGDLIRVVMHSNQVCRTADSAVGSITLSSSAYLTPSVIINSSGGASVCEGSPITFNTINTNAGYSPTFQWSVNSTPVSTSPTYTYLPANGDIVNVQMTSSFPCLATPTASSNMSMVVSPVLNPTGIITVLPGDIIASTTSPITFTCTITSGGGASPTYQWYLNGLPIAGATNYTFTGTNWNSGDSISCVVNNSDPCSGISTFNNIHITIGANVGVGNVNNTAAMVNVVPNPNKGSFNIKGNTGVSTDEDVNIEITNMWGQIVYKDVVRSKNGEIDQAIKLDNTIANGMYLLNVQSEHLNKVFHFVLEQ